MTRWLIDRADASLWEKANSLNWAYLPYRVAPPVEIMIVTTEWRWIFRGGGE